MRRSCGPVTAPLPDRAGTRRAMVLPVGCVRPLLVAPRWSIRRGAGLGNLRAGEEQSMWMDGAFVAGVLASIVTIAIQAVGTLIVIKSVRYASQHLTGRRKVETLVVVMAASGTLLTLTHLLEVLVWALLYDITGATEPDNIYYFAFVNFTTLGYGDLIPARPWRILGPMTAANGMLLFGWSTAVLFAVLSRSITVLRLR